MKDITQTAYIDQSGNVAQLGQTRGELRCAGLVRAVRDADEEAIADFANVAPIDCARLVDRVDPGELRPQNTLDFFRFAQPANSAWPADHRAARRQYRSVFDKR